MLKLYFEKCVPNVICVCFDLKFHAAKENKSSIFTPLPAADFFITSVNAALRFMLLCRQNECTWYILVDFHKKRRRLTSFNEIKIIIKPTSVASSIQQQKYFQPSKNVRKKKTAKMKETGGGRWGNPAWISKSRNNRKRNVSKKKYRKLIFHKGKKKNAKDIRTKEKIYDL